MKKSGITITSIGLALLISLGHPITLMEAYAAENENVESYNISYVLDESKGKIIDTYDEVVMNMYRYAPDDQVIDIPKIFRRDICYHLGKSFDDDITVGDLRSIDDNLQLYAPLEDDEDVDLSWLNYCSCLKSLSIRGNLYKHMDDVMCLENIETITFSSYYDETIDLSNCGFLNYCPNLEEFSIKGACHLEQLYQFKNIKHLCIDISEIYVVDYKKLDYLEELTIYGDPYNIAICLSNDIIDYLEEKGVKISFGNETNMNQIRIINDKLDEIVKGLGLDKNATDDEKINAVLIYVLSNLEYDEEAATLLNAGKSFDHKKFYQGGFLYGALERKTHICGNFAAFVEALLRRVGVNSFMLVSQNHAWNLVEVEGEYYFYDSAWLDGQVINISREIIKEGPNGYTSEVTSEVKRVEDILLSEDSEDVDLLVWYKVNPADFFESPDEYGEEDEAHSAINFPITIVEVKKKITSEQASPLPNSYDAAAEKQGGDTFNGVGSEIRYNNQSIYKPSKKEDKNFGQRIFDVTIGNKKFRITGEVLIGLMIALGGAFNARRMKQKKKSKSTQYYGYDYDGLYFADYFLESGGHKKI